MKEIVTQTRRDGTETVDNHYMPIPREFFRDDWVNRLLHCFFLKFELRVCEASSIEHLQLGLYDIMV